MVNFTICDTVGGKLFNHAARVDQKIQQNLKWLPSPRILPSMQLFEISNEVHFPFNIKHLHVS